MRDSLDILRIDDFVEHHGVKGMHWGVRKAQYKQNVKSIKQKYKEKNKALKKERKEAIKEYITKLSFGRKAYEREEKVKRPKDKIAINKFEESQELMMAKATLYKDINNKKSDKYVKKATEKFKHTYSNRIVRKTPDGVYHITRYYNT